MFDEKKSWITSIKDSTAGIVIGILAGALIWGGDAIESVTKVRNFFWPPVDASLQIAQEGNRAEFSRNLTKLAFARFYAMERFAIYSLSGDAFSPQEKAAAWADYAKLLTEWRNNLMLNILGAEQYYGVKKRAQLEGHIQQSFSDIHRCLQNIITPKLSLSCKFPSNDELKSALQDLNFDLYCFSSGFPDLNRNSGPCWFED